MSSDHDHSHDYSHDHSHDQDSLGGQGQQPGATLARELTDQIEQLILSAESANVPLEIDPQRRQLFDLFVQADAAGFLADDAPMDLSCDAIAKDLAGRWDLRNLGAAVAHPTSLPPAQLARLRVLWSFMRLWMEWSYAWQRWAEFHPADMPTDDMPF